MKSKDSWFAEQFIRWVGAEQLLEEAAYAPPPTAASPARFGNPSMTQARTRGASAGQVSDAARDMT
jgi:hypothetical protein